MTSRILCLLLVVPVSTGLVSCASPMAYSDGAMMAGAPPAAMAAELTAGRSRTSAVDDGRLRIYQAHQTVEVTEVAVAAGQVEDWVAARKGYVDSSTESEDDSNSASFTIRISSTQLDPLLEEFASLGKQTHLRLSASDTTDSYYDLQAKIKNTEALRDRLRRLLDEAEAVKEVLEIEKELARVQSELDSLKGRFQRLDDQVRLATVNLQLRARTIPGPVGAANQGLWWGLKKLFVLN